MILYAYFADIDAEVFKLYKSCLVLSLNKRKNISYSQIGRHNIVKRAVYPKEGNTFKTDLQIQHNSQ